MYAIRRKPKFTLMPLIALATLSLAVTVPALSSNMLHAASPATFSIVTVQANDNLWKIAATRTANGGDVQAVIDQIIAANHLGSAALVPGQRLKLPD
jgi:LysM repeat protein